MRIVAMLTASAHLCLAACAAGSSYDGTTAGAPVTASPQTPYMRCMADFWGNCTAVVSTRHDYRWRYVRPGVRPREAEPAARAAREAEPAARAREAEVSSGRVRETRDSTIICHPRRRVVGDERPSRDDAQRAAENSWMGSIRYDFGERYQDINRAKDVRHVCGPSSVSTVLKTPHYRCVVEATPCRAPAGPATQPDERRHEKEKTEVEMSSRK